MAHGFPLLGTLEESAHESNLHKARGSTANPSRRNRTQTIGNTTAREKTCVSLIRWQVVGGAEAYSPKVSGTKNAGTEPYKAILEGGFSLT